MVKVSELTGMALDWAVAVCEGRREPEVANNFSVAWYTWPNTHYSTSWELCGPIIYREGISLHCGNKSSWNAYAYGSAENISGPTPPVAAMRCYVVSKLGEEIEIPKELL